MCDPGKLSAIREWHAPSSVKQVRQFVGFIGYYRRFIQDFAGLSEPVVALTRKGVAFAWTDRQQIAFDALKNLSVEFPHIGFPDQGRPVYSGRRRQSFGGGGVLNQLQDDQEIVIAYASRSLRLSQRRYCTTLREMLAAVVMCTHFRSYLRGAQFTLRTDHSSLRLVQKFRNSDGMLARWYMLLEQFSVTFEYRPGAQHSNADGLSRQCGQCLRPGCPVSSPELAELLDQPFASRRWATLWMRTCCRNYPR